MDALNHSETVSGSSDFANVSGCVCSLGVKPNDRTPMCTPSIAVSSVEESEAL